MAEVIARKRAALQAPGQNRQTAAISRTAALHAGRLVVDRYSLLFALPFFYRYVALPIASYETNNATVRTFLTPNISDRIFWPTYFILCLVLALPHLRRVMQLFNAPHIQWAAVYMGLATLSLVWAVQPDFVFVRLANELIILSALLCVGRIARHNSDFMKVLYVLFVFAIAMNAIFVANQNEHISMGVLVGYSGYFEGKNILGFFCSFVILISLTQFRTSMLQKTFAALVILCCGVLLLFAKSKSSLAFVLASPALAFLILFLRNRMKISPALFLSGCTFMYFFLTYAGVDIVSRVSQVIYRNPTLSNRTVIWDFVKDGISARPLLGWGYRAFWEVPLEIFSRLPPHPLWVKNMPHGHNGYLDVSAELGYVGLGVLLLFIAKTVNVVGAVSKIDYWRAWCLMTMAIFVILINFVESSWFRGSDPIWMIYVLVMIEAARAWTLMQTTKMG